MKENNIKKENTIKNLIQKERQKKASTEKYNL